MGGGSIAAPRPDARRDREHARLLLAPILARHGCDLAPLDAVLDALVGARRLDGPGTVHWLLGAHPALPAGRRPLDTWIAGHARTVLVLASDEGV